MCYNSEGLLGKKTKGASITAKEFSAGFNIIALEIQKLAKTTQEQFVKIDDVIQSVKETMVEVGTQMQVTRETVQDNTKILDAISKEISEINSHAAHLEEVGKKL